MMNTINKLTTMTFVDPMYEKKNENENENKSNGNQA